MKINKLSCFFAPSLAILVAFMMGVSSAQAEPFTEGKHYELVKNPKKIKGASVEVLEFFNYGCPHCYHLEPTISQWKKSKPDYIDFKQVPAFWNPTFKHYAQAFYTAKTLGKLSELHQPIFKAIHRVGQKMNIQDTAGLQALFVRHGVEKSEFKKAYGSFSTQQQLTMAGRLFRGYGLRSVPVFVVDGRYSTSVSHAGTPEELLKVIEYLAKQSKADKVQAGS